VVVGPVTKLDTTHFAERIAWQVPEQLGCAYLSDDPDQDQPQVICIFRGGRPISLRVGTPCRIEGTYRNVLATSGVPLLIDSDLVEGPNTERPNTNNKK
jgi:hypothetical protein